MTYPVLPVIMPPGLLGCSNGELPDSVLRAINPVGRLYKTAATAFNCLQLSAFFAGVSVNPISSPDTYRTLAQQTAAFYNRFQQTPAGRVPEITRTYQGRVWYLKQGNYAPVATPGTSNHGFGLAVDIADCWTGSKTLTWLLGDGSLSSQALRYGFTWEVADGPQAESWHIRYVCGDQLTAEAERAIAAFPQLDVR